MKHIRIFLMIITVALLFGCGKEFLDYVPKGALSGDLLTTPERLDQLVISAYAGLAYEDHPFQSQSNMWTYGSVRSDDAYKGAAGTGDGARLDRIERFLYYQPDESTHNGTWIRCYGGISRANDALQKMEDVSEQDYPKKIQRQAELRFIRGHYHFVLKLIFKYPVIADDKTAKADLNTLSNSEYTNDELWNIIAEDFQFGVDNLPETQSDVGRASKISAAAYLAKLRLYQAYEQDEQHNVTGINTTRLQDVVDLCDIVINSGQYSLFDDYAKNFLWDNENGVESIFAIQYSIDDGTMTNTRGTGRVDNSNLYSYSSAPGYGCCGYHVPSQNMVNAFKTDANGLPMFDTFNDTEMKDSADFMDNNVDPRLDHTVGIPEHPFKYDPEFIYKIWWARDPNTYGPYSVMKVQQHPDSPGFTKAYKYFYASSKNFDLLRYDMVLLWKAEALIELGRQDEALPIINQIRERANNSINLLRYSNGDYVSNYFMDIYQPTVNCTWTQDFARNALRWERRLEFGTECWRFFDLVRWGIAAETINDYFEVEKNRHEYLNDARFTKNKDEYMPIPEQQIDFSEGLYTQNYGW